MTQFPLLGLIAAMFVGGSAYAASPPATPTRFSISGSLQPASSTSGRYALDAQVTATATPAGGKQPDPIPNPASSPIAAPRFALVATLRDKGGVDAASAPCAVNDLFKTSFE